MLQYHHRRLAIGDAQCQLRRNDIVLMAKHRRHPTTASLKKSAGADFFYGFAKRAGDFSPGVTSFPQRQGLPSLRATPERRLLQCG
jgi:hypothetical protein